MGPNRSIKNKNNAAASRPAPYQIIKKVAVHKPNTNEIDANILVQKLEAQMVNSQTTMNNFIDQTNQHGNAINKLSKDLFQLQRMYNNLHEDVYSGSVKITHFQLQLQDKQLGITTQAMEPVVHFLKYITGLHDFKWEENIFQIKRMDGNSSTLCNSFVVHTTKKLADIIRSSSSTKNISSYVPLNATSNKSRPWISEYKTPDQLKKDLYCYAAMQLLKCYFDQSMDDRKPTIKKHYDKVKINEDKMTVHSALMKYGFTKEELHHLIENKFLKHDDIHKWLQNRRNSSPAPQ